MTDKQQKDTYTPMRIEMIAPITYHGIATLNVDDSIVLCSS